MGSIKRPDGPEEKGPSDDQIREAALDWFMRSNGKPLSPQDRLAFENWLAADPRHQTSYDAVSQLWGSQVFAQAIETAHAVNQPKRRLPVRPLMAAAAACVALILAFGWYGGVIPAGINMMLADHATAVGEQKTLTLTGGSRITLNSSSSINVESTEQGYRIRLIGGEAFFEVTPQDSGQSFVVTANDNEVRVLGTAFFVRRDGAETVVGVQEGDVAVLSPALERRVSLGAGDQLGVDAGGNREMTALAERDLAWIDGRIEFHKRPLGAVVEDLRRHHPGVIIIANENLRNIPVSGNFRLDSPEVAIAALAAAVSADLVKMTGYMLILR